jgi:integrase
VHRSDGSGTTYIFSNYLSSVSPAWAAGGRGPLTANGIYQMVKRRGNQAGVDVRPHRFRHHFSHTWLDRGGAEGDLMELNGWSSSQMLRRYGASARSARARRSYGRIMDDAPSWARRGPPLQHPTKTKYPPFCPDTSPGMSWVSATHD